MSNPFIKLSKVFLSIDDLDVNTRLFQKKYIHEEKGNTHNFLGSEIEVVDNLNKSKILNNINLYLTGGDNLGVIGHNGCGKTSILRVLSSIYPTSKGECIIFGETNSFLEIGASLNPEANGYCNIELLCRLQKKYDFSQNDINEISDISELGSHLNNPVKNYSAGMLSRLLFSIMIINQKDIMIYDEGLSVGDEYFRNKAEKIIKKNIKKSKINIFASHSMEFVEENCNKIAVMKKGHLKVFNDVSEGINYYLSKNYSETNYF